MDDVFKALADPTRRDLLDRLRAEDGQTLGQLCAAFGMSRQAVSRHLQVLEEASLVVTTWRGREKLHHLNRVPLQQIADRWIGQYHQPRLAALTGLKQALESTTMTEASDFAYSLYIDAPAERIWQALTNAEFTRQYWSGRQLQSSWEVGAPLEILTEDGTPEVTGTILASEAPHRLSYSWYSISLARESTVTFELKPFAGSVQLTIVHGPLMPDSRAREGWVAILSSLKSLLETGKPLEATKSWPRQARSA